MEFYGKRRRTDQQHTCRMPPQPRYEPCQDELHRSAAPSCNDSLLAQSYLLPARWPLSPFHLVMETSPGNCDLYKERTTCCLFTQNFGEPERHVREPIASFLSHCSHHRATPCRAVDLGANNGWFSAMMLQLGAYVTSVEPSPDLARAVRQTAVVNCWASRSTVINAFVCTPMLRHSGGPCRQELTPAPGCKTGGWRWGWGPSRLAQLHGENCSAHEGLPQAIGRVDLAATLLAAAGCGAHGNLGEHPSAAAQRATSGGSSSSSSSACVLDMIKMDADGPEGAWVDVIEDLIRRGSLTVRAMVIEGSALSPRVMQALQVSV